MVWELKTGAITFWNQGSEALYGWQRREVLGRTPQAILQTKFPMPLSEINAVLGLAQCQRLDEILDNRRRVAHLYMRRLLGNKHLILPTLDPAPGEAAFQRSRLS